MKKIHYLAYFVLGVFLFTFSSYSLPSNWPESGLMVVPHDSKGRNARDIFAACVEEAKISIDLVMYTLLDPIMIDHLLKAHEKGVKIRIIKEKQVYQHDNNEFKGPDPLQKLIAAGIPIQGLAQRFLDVNDKAQAHHKILIIDGKYAILTSANWDEPTFRSTRDFSVALTQEQHPDELKEIQAVFEADWNNQPIEPKNPNLIWGPDHQIEKLQNFIKQATRSISIYQQSFNDPHMTNLLCEMARRGIEVKLLMMPFPFGGEVDRNNLFQEQLMQAGGKVHFNLDYFIHAKIILIDDNQAYIGSCNFYPPSLKYNREVGFITKDPNILKELSSVFVKDWETAKGYQEARNIHKNWS